MSKCLRCGAGAEWLQGKVPDEAVPLAEWEQMQAELVRLTAELAAARLQLSAIRWHRVADGMPPKAGEYLVVHAGIPNVMFGSFGDVFSNGELHWIESAYASPITHWREIGPLPAESLTKEA